MIDAAVEESVAQNQVLTEAVPHQFEGPLTIPLAHYSIEVSNYAPQCGTMIGTLRSSQPSSAPSWCSRSKASLQISLTERFFFLIALIIPINHGQQPLTAPIGLL